MNNPGPYPLMGGPEADELSAELRAMEAAKLVTVLTERDWTEFDHRAEWWERWYDLQKPQIHVDPFTQEDADELDDHLAQAAARGRDLGR